MISTGTDFLIYMFKKVEGDDFYITWYLNLSHRIMLSDSPQFVR